MTSFSIKPYIPCFLGKLLQNFGEFPIIYCGKLLLACSLSGMDFTPLSYSRVFLKVFPKATLKSDTFLTLCSYTKSMNQSIGIWMMEQWAFSGTWFTYLQISIMKIAIPHLYFVMRIKNILNALSFFETILYAIRS